MDRLKLDFRAQAYSDAADCLYAMAADCGHKGKAKEYEFVAKKLDKQAQKLYDTKDT